jgi:hypothetical protein
MEHDTAREQPANPTRTSLKIRAVSPSGQARNLEIRPDPVGEGTGEELMDLLLETLEIEESTTDESGAPRRDRSRTWKLRNVTRNRFIDPNQPLGPDDLGPGDTVEVVGSMVAGLEGQ